MSDYKKNTLLGQYNEYLKDPLENLLNLLRVPQKGEPGYVDVAKDVSDNYLKNPQLPEEGRTSQPVSSNITSNSIEQKPIDEKVVNYLKTKGMVKEQLPQSEIQTSPKNELPELEKKPGFMDKYNEEAYAKAKADSDSRQEGLSGLQFLAGVGDALAQRNPSESIKNFNNIRNQIKDETIGQYQRDKAQAVDDFKNKQMMDQYDPNSESSKTVRNLMRQQFIEANMPKLAAQINDNMSARKINELMPQFTKMIDTKIHSDDTKAQRQMMLDFKKSELERKNQPSERIKNLSGQDKARFDNALMVLKGIDEMGQALDKDQNTFSLVGDNDYTAASRRATEAYGRMQSGGAINKDEEKRFEATLPRSADSKEIQRKKLLTQRAEMLSRLKTLGFTPQDIGYEPQSFNYGQPKQNSKPKQIIQNGHTYILNESTGEYE